MNKFVIVSPDEAWMAVSLEERLELVTRANSEGIIAWLIGSLLLGSVAYGLDKFWFFVCSVSVCLLLIPMIANFTWRRAKPELIMRLLAARSMARRYARAYKIENTESLFVFQGEVQESNEGPKAPVWICLLKGGVVLLSERPGGARLEFISAIKPETAILPEEDNRGARRLFLTGTNIDSGRTIIISSRYRAALYVFERLLGQAVAEVLPKK